ncbi:SCO family protein [Sphingosinicellaceae bacterium]|nr:SCO family protein [Sphingosinicellaceae bacterium]
MNSRRTLWLAISAVAAVVAAVFLWPGLRGTVPTAPLAGSSIGGPFALVDQHGRQFTEKNLKGLYSLVYFGYTYCPDVCPLDVQNLSQGLAAFEKAKPRLGAKVVPVFITVDPERDDPAALTAFAANFHPRLVALTGSVAAIDAAKKAYKVYARRAGPPGAKAGPAGAKDYLMDHAAMTYLMGPDGAPIDFLPHGTTPAQVADELARYVR